MNETKNSTGTETETFTITTDTKGRALPLWIRRRIKEGTMTRQESTSMMDLRERAFPSTKQEVK